MRSEWRQVSVDDIKDSSPYALATGPFGSSISSKYFQNEGIPVIRGSNLSEDIEIRLDHRDLVFLTKEKAKEFKRSVARKGDLIFTCWGTIGQVGLIDDRCLFDEYIVSNKQMKFTPDPTQADSLFLYYLFSGPDVSEQIKSAAIGSSVPGFNLGGLRSIKFDLPSLPTQRAIARILGALDDKIDLNRHMNRTLEAMAQAVFKSWFVDFDPVTAKAEGRQPFGMDAETAGLFPEKFIDSPEGLIPDGWEILPLGEMVTAVGGATPSTDNAEYWGDEYHWSTPKDLSKLDDPVLTTTERKITAAGLNRISSGLLPPGTLLLSSRAPVGYLAICEIPTAINQGFIAMLCNKGVPNQYMLRWTKENMETIISHANGTTFQEISKASFRTIPALKPTQMILERYDELASKLYKQMVNNVKQNETLAALRDTLLPRLLSGELTVRAEEEAVGEISESNS